MSELNLLLESIKVNFNLKLITKISIYELININFVMLVFELTQSNSPKNNSKSLPPDPLKVQNHVLRNARKN